MKSTMTGLMLVIAIAPVAVGSALAGTLDPPGPPAPTMVTLQQIYDKVCAPADVAKTGQTGCWNTFSPINCAGTGQDGELQKGVSTAPRFTSNADGTVKDNLTGLIWLKNADCFDLRTWTSALSNVNALASGACGLTDGSVAGTWRLPNVRELQSLIDFGSFAPALPSGHPFTAVQPYNYWSSTTSVGGWSFAWIVGLVAGNLSDADKTTIHGVWPVRSGP